MITPREEQARAQGSEEPILIHGAPWPEMQRSAERGCVEDQPHELEGQRSAAVSQTSRTNLSDGVEDDTVDDTTYSEGNFHPIPYGD